MKINALKGSILGGIQQTKRNMSVQPTLTIRPGFPMRVMVSKDLILRPYQPLFFVRGSSQ